MINRYLLRVVGAAIICSSIRAILPGKGMVPAITKMLGGIFLAFTVISPIATLEIEKIMTAGSEIEFSGTRIALQGDKEAEEAYRAGIKSRTEAYVLEKAAVLAPGLSVEVTLSEDELPVPCEVILSGEVSPYAKSSIQEILSTDLNIPKEAQIWTG